MSLDVKAARLCDLHGQFLYVWCGAWVRGRRCGHSGRVTPASLPPGFSMETPVRDLPRHLKCSKCGQRSAETRISVWR